METLKTLYSSDFVEMTIVDMSTFKYKDCAALRIVTHTDFDGDVDTVEPISKPTINKLLRLEDWNDDPAFYKVLKDLYSQAPITSNEEAGPTLTEDLQTKETR